MALMIDLDKNEQSADRRAAWTALVFTAMAMGWNAAQARLPEGKRITEQSPIGKWISELPRPDHEGNCCGVSDCYLTEARFDSITGQWWARQHAQMSWKDGQGWIPEDEGAEVPIPREKIIQDENLPLKYNLPEKAVLCNSMGYKPQIYCFVKPPPET